VKYSAEINLLLYYVGFGFVLLLAWAGVLSDAIRTEPPRRTRTEMTVLRVLGIVHPAAALAAWDIRRELDRDRTSVAASSGGFPVEVAASLVIATIVVLVTTRT
jgi:hypothetical protein